MLSYFGKLKEFDTICYFYSTYDVPKNEKSLEITQEYEFGNISWENIYVWDETQKNTLLKYVRKDLFNINIIVTGPIWFLDSNFILPDNDKRLIIYDMEVHRKSIHYGWYDTAEYTDLIDNFNCIFLNDIFKTFNNYGYEVVLKRKRASHYSRTNYKKLISKLEKKGLVIADEHVSPFYLLKNCSGTISTPFTSANLYTSKKINNIYYDPIKLINKNDTAARGIKVISGIEELEQYKKEFYG